MQRVDDRGWNNSARRKVSDGYHRDSKLISPEKREESYKRGRP